MEVTRERYRDAVGVINILQQSLLLYNQTNKTSKLSLSLSPAFTVHCPGGDLRVFGGISEMRAVHGEWVKQGYHDNGGFGVEFYLSIFWSPTSLQNQLMLLY